MNKWVSFIVFGFIVSTTTQTALASDPMAGINQFKDQFQRSFLAKCHSMKPNFSHPVFKEVVVEPVANCQEFYDAYKKPFFAQYYNDTAVEEMIDSDDQMRQSYTLELQAWEKEYQSASEDQKPHLLTAVLDYYSVVESLNQIHGPLSIIAEAEIEDVEMEANAAQ